MTVIVINDRWMSVDDTFNALSREQLLALAGGMPDAQVVVENAGQDGADKLLADFESVSLTPPLRVRITPLADYTVRFADSQIKHMVDRFLGWRLPEDFNPDAGISFKPTFNDHLPTPMRHNPTGTNLLHAQQAEAMVRYMVEGLPTVTRATDLQKVKG